MAPGTPSDTASRCGHPTESLVHLGTMGTTAFYHCRGCDGVLFGALTDGE